MFKKILLTVVTAIVVFSFVIPLAIGVHGNPEMMIFVLIVSTIIGVAAGMATYVIWTD